MNDEKGELVSTKKGYYYTLETYAERDGSLIKYRLITDDELRVPKDGDVWVSVRYDSLDDKLLQFGPSTPYKIIDGGVFVCNMSKSPSVGYSLVDTDGKSRGGGAGSIDFLYIGYRYLGNIYEGYKIPIAEDVFKSLENKTKILKPKDLNDKEDTNHI